jgi:hypothetical protein
MRPEGPPKSPRRLFLGFHGRPTVHSGPAVRGSCGSPLDHASRGRSAAGRLGPLSSGRPHVDDSADWPSRPTGSRPCPSAVARPAPSARCRVDGRPRTQPTPPSVSADVVSVDRVAGAGAGAGGPTGAVRSPPLWAATTPAVEISWPATDRLCWARGRTLCRNARLTRGPASRETPRRVVDLVHGPPPGQCGPAARRSCGASLDRAGRDRSAAGRLGPLSSGRPHVADSAD